MAVETSVRPSEVFDQRLAKAFAHPMRMEILTILDRRVASPNELSKELGEGLSQVSYHVKVLKELKCIELVDTKPRRGAVEHYYRAISRPFLSVREWEQLPASVQRTISGSIVQMVIEDAAEALGSGTFDSREDRHLSRTPLLLDEEGWAELASVLGETLERALDIQAESAARISKSGGEGILSKLELLHFESPPPGSKTPSRKS